MQSNSTIKSVVALALFSFNLVQCNLFNNEPNRPNIPGKILIFDRNPGVDLRLYQMQANGSAVVNLTETFSVQMVAHSGSWWENGNTILLHAYKGGGIGSSLYYLQNGETTIRTLSYSRIDSINRPTPGYYPRGDQFGRYVLFEQCNPCGGKSPSDILLFDNEINSLTNLTNTTDWAEIRPTFLTDTIIAYYKVYNYYPIFISQLAIKDITDITTEQILIDGGVDRHLVASPNGDYLLYEGAKQFEGRDIRLLDIATLKEVPLNHGFKFRAYSGNWNATGTHLVLIGKTSEDSEKHLRYYEFDNGNVTLLDSLKHERIAEGEHFDWYSE